MTEISFSGYLRATGMEHGLRINCGLVQVRDPQACVEQWWATVGKHVRPGALGEDIGGVLGVSGQVEGRQWVWQPPRCLVSMFGTIIWAVAAAGWLQTASA